MSGYLGALKYTGVPEIDSIIEAVRDSGDRYHHTRGWTDDDYGDGSCVDRINAASKKSAEAVLELKKGHQP